MYHEKNHKEVAVITVASKRDSKEGEYEVFYPEEINGKITLYPMKVYYDENFIKEMDVTLDEKLEFSLIKWININIENIIIFTGVLIIFISGIILIYKKKNLNRKKDRKYSKK